MLDGPATVAQHRAAKRLQRRGEAVRIATNSSVAIWAAGAGPTRPLESAAAGVAPPARGSAALLARSAGPAAAAPAAARGAPAPRPSAHPRLVRRLPRRA
eukprot:8907583-Heterocapsa_arctica.AAC.1